MTQFNSAISLSKNKLEQRQSILVLDDDPVFGRVLQYQLKAHGFDCILCASSQQMQQALRSGVNPDLFVLDYFLGDTDTGLDICRELKADYSERPVMLLTANRDTEAIIECLGTGANQYVTKPCDFREVIARIEAALRNGTLKVSHRRPRDKQLIKLHDGLSYQRRSHSLSDTKSGKVVTLTRHEGMLLEALAASEGWCVGRFEIFRRIYGYEMPPMNRSIDMLACRLRTKLRAVNPAFSILAVRNAGYELVKQ